MAPSHRNAFPTGPGIAVLSQVISDPSHERQKMIHKTRGSHALLEDREILNERHAHRLRTDE